MRFGLALCFGLLLSGCSKVRNAAPTMMQSASPVSVMLSVGIGSAQTFTAAFKDPKGGSQIAEVTLSIMSNNVLPGGKSRWSGNECLVRYDIAANAIWLVPDVGGTWGSHAITAGSSSTFSNSQCTVLASGSSAQISGNTVTVNLELKFAAEFAGTKQLYLASEDVDGNWSANYQQPFGSFIIPAARTP
jgi:hypothetical protein